MNFFRLRVINTVLFFLLGALIGFILKERLFPAKPKEYRQAYQPEYSAQGEQPDEAEQPGAAPQIETSVESEEPEEPVPAEPRPARRAAPAREEQTEAAVIEAVPAQKGADAAPRALRGEQDEFFSRPQDYSGKELEMDLQLITAKRSQRGWRLNFVHTTADKRVDYLYADDEDGLLGGKPDLRIGYVYKLRFRCSRGETAAGNFLTFLAPTGEKAAWATGLSAIE